MDEVWRCLSGLHEADGHVALYDEAVSQAMYKIMYEVAQMLRNN